ncbi:Pyridoxine/pyridoxamine 5'-phosphate oxidase [Neolewinella maritima]|uniref:Pyridoxine/pyridoxamine 5'-phosphate oxidase n=1 Tax=Neolewinella maritima TaxID=1383882 RepID=A0ABN8F584_9BACT|nr:pyridoxamine 5'-phosphate oxidase [Neolewinella maritima]CAH1001207.1 Pyridoxine/pyridoxamine 5'-phosphate oxidase [Neolewinella maritima]
MPIDAQDLRVDYQADQLLEQDAPATDPFPLFNQWFEAAKDSDDPEPNAMVVATINAQGHPAARTVLLKEVSDRGFIFYTNYDSRKGHEISAHPHVAVVFNWLQLQRSVRIEGRVEKLSEEASTEYFQSRPKKSQIGAWTSPQSDVIPSRELLEARQEEMEQRFADQEKLPKPDHWGGFVVIPTLIEFWQGRSSRLHDRLAYSRTEETSPSWTRERLAP